MQRVGLSELADRASTLAAGPGRTLLGIVGPPGAGKSTVCAKLTAALGERSALVGMDGFHLDNDVLVALGRRERKGAPDTFDVPGYVSLLTRLRTPSQDVVYAPRFDRAHEQAIGSAVPVSPQVELVITEGNYLLYDQDGWDQVRGLLDQVWYLQVTEEEIRRRLLARRMAHGESRAEALPWVTEVDLPNAARVASSRARADVVFDVHINAGEDL
ncbi:MAG: nucleoside/nucleotide kinase family protein [Propioniciclava sp.]